MNKLHPNRKALHTHTHTHKEKKKRTKEQSQRELTAHMRHSILIIYKNYQGCDTSEFFYHVVLAFVYYVSYCEHCGLCCLIQHFIHLTRGTWIVVSLVVWIECHQLNVVSIISLLCWFYRTVLWLPLFATKEWKNNGGKLPCKYNIYNNNNKTNKKRRRSKNCSNQTTEDTDKTKYVALRSKIPNPTQLACIVIL